MGFGMFEWSAGDLGSAMLENLTDFIAGEERKPGVDPSAVQNKYNQQRDGVRDDASGIGFQGAYRPQSVHRTDDFDRPGTAELRAKVDRIDIAAVDNLATAWNEIGKRAETSLNNFTNAMKRATDEGIWRGASRNAAAKAVSDYGTEAVQLSNAAKLTANKVAELKSGLEPTKALVPHAPDLRSNVENTRHWIAGRGWRDNQEAIDSAHTEAVRVLRTVYAPVIKETDTNVPVIPKPTNPTSNNTDIPTGGGDPTQQRSKSPTTNPASGSENPQSEKPSETPTNPQGSDQASPTSSQSTNPSSQQQSAKSDSPATNPAGANPTGTNPASANPTGTNPGSRGGSGSGSPTSGSPGSGSSTPSPGRSVTGTPVAAGLSAGAATNAAAASSTGRNGMGGMGSPGSRGGGKDDESSKGIPDYLINQENGEQVTGLDSLPGTVPPVIGA
ncbi:hypothetical protein [Nocardia noduli]|uniref:hypothetical protein n=1 Tax=Nocardia noduli TaxID=2815722 RepID=UPI001C23B68E|nr:hypothetical protein [Nocardia noduli]